MRTFDFSPLWRSTIGFDHLADLLDSNLQQSVDDNYPPYNVERCGEDAYRISLAVAGFGMDDIAVTAASTAAAPRRRRARRKGFGLNDVARVLFLVGYLIFLLAPLYWVVITSIKPVDDYMAIPPVWFPDKPTLSQAVEGADVLWGRVIGLAVPASVSDEHRAWLAELITKATEDARYKERGNTVPGRVLKIRDHDNAVALAQSIYDFADPVVRGLGLHFENQ